MECELVLIKHKKLKIAFA